MVFSNQAEVVARLVSDLGDAHLSVDPESVHNVLVACFWASLQSNEHEPCRFVVAYPTPEPGQTSSVAIDSAIIRRYALAAHGPSMLLIHADGHRITTRRHRCAFKIESMGPGQLRLFDDLGQVSCTFGFQAGRAFMLRPGVSSVIDVALKRVFAHVSQPSCTALRRIVSAIASRRHGGSLVMTDEGLGGLLRYSDLVFEGARVADVERAIVEGARRIDNQATRVVFESAQLPFRQGVATAISLLADIDGALILGSDLGVRYVGATLLVEEEPTVLLVELDSAQMATRTSGDVDGLEGLGATSHVALSDLGGTRHQSLARFIGSVDDAVGIAVSADGPITLFLKRGPAAVTAIRGIQWGLWAD